MSCYNYEAGDTRGGCILDPEPWLISLFLIFHVLFFNNCVFIKHLHYIRNVTSHMPMLFFLNTYGDFSATGSLLSEKNGVVE